MALVSSADFQTNSILKGLPVKSAIYVPPPPPPPASQKDLHTLYVQVQALSKTVTNMQNSLASLTSLEDYNGQVILGLIQGLEQVMSQLNNLQGNAVQKISF